MDNSRDRTVFPENGSPIRLRYSTQVQIEGHTHTIDAEISLPVGASQELREQIIRETEQGVEQLARQLRQRANRSPEATRLQTQAQARTRADTPVSRPAENTRSADEVRSRPATNPPMHAPISESMPATPTTRSENKQITLPQFVNALNKHLQISPTDAMKLLHIETLDGLNYWDAYKQLQTVLAQKSTGQETHTTSSSGQMRPTTEQPAPRRNEQQNAPQGQASRPDPGRNEASRETPGASGADNQSRRTTAVQEPVRETVGTPKGPQPLQFSAAPANGTPSRALQFDEEDEELSVEDEDDAYEYEEEDEDEEYALPVDREKERASAQLKLERLKGIRGSQAASAERLRVLDTLINSQISEEQLQTIIQSAWGAANTKKLKNAQVEELISWAKEDFFVEEAEAMLKLIQGVEE
jgi:hypothetical protein